MCWDELTQQVQEGTFVEEGRKDILAVALGKDEHPGRVRGVGKGKGIKDVFGTSSRGRSSGSTAMSQDQLRDYVSGEIGRAKQDMLGTFIGALKAVATPEPDGHIRLSVNNLIDQLGYKDAQTMSMSPQQQRSFRLSYGEKDPLQEVDHPCHLFIEDEDEGKRVMVAIGMVTSSRVLHNRDLPDDEVRVRVNKVKLGWAPLPIPLGDEIIQVRQAKGTFVAWPRDLVDMTLGNPEVSPASRASKAKKAAPTDLSLTSDAGECLARLKGFLGYEEQGERIQYIVDQLVQSQKSYLLLSVLRCAHWTLVLICPLTSKVYFLDPMGCRPTTEINAYSEYIYRGGSFARNRSTLQWIYSSLFNSTVPYSEEQIDEIREELAKYTLQQFSQ